MQRINRLLHGQVTPKNNSDLAFKKFVQNNPAFLLSFLTTADQLRALGYSTYSADAIVHTLRTNQIINGSRGIKVNNNITSYLARYYNETNTPFFKTRYSRSLDR